MEDSGGVPWLKSGLSAKPSATARYKIPKDRRSGARPSTKASQKLGRLLRPKEIAPHSPCERISTSPPGPNAYPSLRYQMIDARPIPMTRRRTQLRKRPSRAILNDQV